MLVIRKELKVGLGIGAAVLGILLVYGLMAALSTKTPTTGQQATNTDEAVPSSTDSSAAVPGLPPKDDSTATAKPAAKTPGGDPFAESARSDGNKSDPWTDALNTGKVPVETGIASTASTFTPSAVTAKAAAPGKTDDATVRTSGAPRGSDASAAGGPIVTQAPLVSDPVHMPASHGTGDTSTKLTTTAQPAGGTYTVVAGDTFTRIATKLYGDRRLAAALIKANPNIEPTKLRTGVAIVVPAKDEVASIRGSVAPAAPKLTGTVDSSREYRVVAGDTLSRVAVKLYGRRAMWEAIYDSNKSVIGSDPGRLKVGEVLSLPKPPEVASR